MRLKLTIATLDGTVLDEVVVIDEGSRDITPIPEEQASDRDRVRFATKISDHVANRFNMEDD